MDVREKWLAHNFDLSIIDSKRSFQRVLDWLDKTDFWTAPASTKFHSAFEGGLAYHSLKMAGILCRLTELHGIVWEKQESPIVVSLLHDVCKVGCYHRDNNGKYTFGDSDCPMGHAAKSIILAQPYFEFTTQEQLCILWHMGDFSESKPGGFGTACKKDIAVFWTHVADRLAAFEEVEEEKDD